MSELSVTFSRVQAAEVRLPPKMRGFLGLGAMFKVVVSFLSGQRGLPLQLRRAYGL